MMRFHEIRTPTYVDGPGKRSALFVQGCSIRCSFCQNPHLWPTDAGQEATPTALAEALTRIVRLPITISGGEPFDQPHALARLLREIRRLAPDRHVIIFTGYTFEELLNTCNYDIFSTLADADVLVDGPYIQELDHDTIQYRGSTNQRVIDLPATFSQPATITLTQGPVLLNDDWDQPELILTTDGDLLAPSPLTTQFAAIGDTAATRRCGETSLQTCKLADLPTLQNKPKTP